jgi:putative membrane-bound dehydrogenase-like protein
MTMSSRPIFRAPLVSRRRRQSIRLVLVSLAALAAAVVCGRPEGFVRKIAAMPQAAASPGGAPLHVLFLGQDKGPSHDPESMFPLLASPLARQGIQLTYVRTPEEAFDPARLRYYDALMIYGNHTTLAPAQEKVLLDFVEGGKGLIAIHSASAEFTNSAAYISLIGGQFQRHGTGDFTAEIVRPEHPVMRGIEPFETWDETYVHTKHNPVDRTVLMERVDANGREPYTWVRTQGRGRVFYTAYGHDARTWSKPQFEALIRNGVVWAVDEPARQAYERLKMPEVQYVDGYNVPNYERRDPAPKYQVGFAPEDAARFVVAPAEFDVTLFASEPMFLKAIAMQFDERGRLWIAEAHDYPNLVLNGAKGNDVIKILEDTDGDGKADRSTIFADGINLVTSLVFANGGVIVSAAPNFLFFKDTDGDDKADVRQVLSTGWGTTDTHAGPSNLTYGIDNHIWGTVGYSGFNGTMNGRQMQFGQGAYRFKPDGTDFDYVTRSTNNTWGIAQNETGDIFGSTANGDPSWYLGIPNHYWEHAADLGPGAAVPTMAGRGAGPGYRSIAEFTAVHYLTPYIRQVDQMGSYTAGAGHNIYTARAFPKSYWNRIAFVNEPTVHITGQVVLESSGAGYVGRDGWNLVAGAEEFFSPVSSIVGPDGAVWVSDWYNFVNQHNPTPDSYMTGRGNAYETSMRDHSRGRIYRIAYKGAPAAQTRSLSKTDPAGLMAALASDNMFWRLTAQRLLIERGQKDVVPQLIALVGQTTMDSIGINGGAMHALWTLEGLGELSDPASPAYAAAVAALKHPAAGVRKQAARVLPKTPAAAEAIIAANLLADPDLHTRLAAILALSDMPASPAVASALYKASKDPQNFGDSWLSRAIYLASAAHKAPFLDLYTKDRTHLPFTALSVPLRMGNLTPDWRLPVAAELTSEWKEMRLPGVWEDQGLSGFDGTVWFSRTVDIAAGAPLPTTISLGPVRNSAQVWLNGTSLTPTAGRGRGAAPPPAPVAPGQVAPVLRPPPGAVTAQVEYPIPEGIVRAGANTITVRVTNTRSEGGFVGSPADMYLTDGQARTPLAGAWKYRVERSSDNAAVYSKPGELAAHIAFVAGGGIDSAAAAALPVVSAVPDVTIRLGVVPGQMKYTTTNFTVTAGQMVEVVLTNTDQMQHNFVLGLPGSLDAIGAGADQMAARPGAAAVSYTPEMGEILAKTPLVDPGQSVRVQFRAPATAGAYPYLCTFPQHWRVMNGVMTVAAPPQGRRGGGAPAGGARGGRLGGGAAGRGAGGQ